MEIKISYDTQPSGDRYRFLAVAGLGLCPIFFIVSSTRWVHSPVFIAISVLMALLCLWVGFTPAKNKTPLIVFRFYMGILCLTLLIIPIVYDNNVGILGYALLAFAWGTLEAILLSKPLDIIFVYEDRDKALLHVVEGKKEKIIPFSALENVEANMSTVTLTWKDKPRNFVAHRMSFSPGVKFGESAISQMMPQMRTRQKQRIFEVFMMGVICVVTGFTRQYAGLFWAVITGGILVFLGMLIIRQYKKHR